MIENLPSWVKVALVAANISEYTGKINVLGGLPIDKSLGTPDFSYAYCTQKGGRG